MFYLCYFIAMFIFSHWKSGWGFLLTNFFWQYPIAQTFCLITNFWLVYNTFYTYVKTLLVVDTCVCNTFIVYVMTLALGLWSRQEHGMVWADIVIRKSHSHFHECKKMWGNEPTHSQVDSHFESWNLYEVTNIQRAIWGVKIHWI
jgi:hypothetical protein